MIVHLAEHRPHQHDWTAASRHATSEGWVVYESCGCGRWRVVELVAIARGVS